MTLSGLDIIARSADFEQRAAACELRSWQWALLHALDERTEMRDVARAHGLDLEQALAFCNEAAGAGLVCVGTMTLEEYRRESGMSAHVESAEDDRLSSDDLLERDVPAWMIAHDDEQAGTQSQSEHAQASEYQQYVEAEPVAEWHGEPAAQWHDESVHAEAAHAEYDYSQPVAEWHAEHDHAEPMAEWNAPEPLVGSEAYQAAAEQWQPDSERHAEAANEDQPERAFEAPSYDHHSYAWHSGENAAPVALSFEAEPQHDASDAVAGLISGDSHAESQAASDEPTTYGDHFTMGNGSFEHDAVNGSAIHHEAAHDEPAYGEASHEAASHAEAAAEPAHESVPSWEPMHLVTSVDSQAGADPIDPGVPDGIDIQIGGHDPGAEYVHPHDEPHASSAAPAYEAYDDSADTGSIAFSFAPDEPMFEIPPSAPRSSAYVPAPDPASEPQPEPSRTISYEESAPQAAEAEPSHDEDMKQKSDLVGNLLAKALTFRMK